MAMLDPGAGRDGFAVIRERQSVPALWRDEIVPAWLR